MFNTIPVSEEDAGQILTYTISEVIPNNPELGYIYDEHIITAKIMVVDNGDGTLHCEVEYEGKTVFENVYDDSLVPKTPGENDKDKDKPNTPTNPSKTTTKTPTTTNKTTNVAKTGDEMPIELYLILLVATGALIGLIRKRREIEREK